ncbi:hypothetical protein ACFFX0_16810 [Citricoccus parietis]|uniref:Uncharacterized protein n=1 Tax=Citricoccus parietis TaxID=592307 RepID=A0ABV5G280_9MICC
MSRSRRPAGRWHPRSKIRPRRWSSPRQSWTMSRWRRPSQSTHPGSSSPGRTRPAASHRWRRRGPPRPAGRQQRWSRRGRRQLGSGDGGTGGPAARRRGGHGGWGSSWIHTLIDDGVHTAVPGSGQRSPRGLHRLEWVTVRHPLGLSDRYLKVHTRY